MALPLNRVNFSLILTYLFIFVGKSLAAEEGLRPSDHGLHYQSTSPPLQSQSPPGKIKSFFGDASSPPSSSSRSQLLPKAIDTEDDGEWWRDGDEKRHDHVMRHVFLAASIVCGVFGVALLVVFALVYFFRHKKEHNSKELAL
ncbi:unnamed protein product [Cochlearia groenlandica]